MRIAFVDAFSGVAGDMLLGGLLDVGGEGLLADVLEGLKTLPIKDEFSLEVRRVHKSMGRIAALSVIVKSRYNHQPAPVPSDEDDHQHSHDHSHDHGHSHSHSHNHSHSHSHAIEGEEESGAPAAAAGPEHHGEKEEESLPTGLGQVARSLNSDLSAVGEEEKNSTSLPPHPPPAPATSKLSEPLRNLDSICELLRESKLPEVVKERTIDVFTALGQAEAETHGTTLSAVHFHEVGAVDSIIDVTGCVLALHLLGVEQLHCSPLPMSSGTVFGAHGIMPVPAPATLRLLVGIPVCPGPKSASGELVTPTGAALVKVLCQDRFGRSPCFTPAAVGVGAGTKDFAKHPNILRVVIGDTAEGAAAAAAATTTTTTTKTTIGTTPAFAAGASEWEEEEELSVLEANVDDMTGEAAAWLVEQALAKGALDCWTSPIVMKKGRPAMTLHVLHRNRQEDKSALLRLLFEESPTLGVRVRRVGRCALERRTVAVQLRASDLLQPSPAYQSPVPVISVKLGVLDGKVVKAKAEFEDCRAVALLLGVPLQRVRDAARQNALGKDVSLNETSV